MTTKSPCAAARSAVSSLARRSRSCSISASIASSEAWGSPAADLEALVRAELGRRAHADLHGEGQGLALAGQAGHVDLGIAHRHDARGVDRVGVPAAERLAHGLVEDGVAADAPDDHRRGHLAPAEAGHAELAAEGARGLLDALLDLGGGDLRLDAHARLGKLGDGGLDVVRHERGTIASGSVPASRFRAWLYTGPVGHLAAGIADWAELLAHYAYARARGRDPWA